ncbi:MAG: FliH/SctL family protein [Porticoccaceae bacterium]|nr:FliH/SctL family protein [Porticoccaceae bacterium]
MSNDTSVSWRLNDLLTADKKAKEFAAAGWNDGEQVAQVEAAFEQFSPTVVDLEDLRQEEFVEELEEEVIAEENDSLEDIPPVTTEGPMDSSPVSDERQARELQEAAAVYAEEALQQAKREAHDAGYEKGRAESEAHYQKSKDNLDQLVASLRTAQSDMTEFYQPLKKLALHLAEQLVRGELSLSSSAIERIAKAALDDVESQGEGPILIYLHPADRDQFGDELYDEFSTIELRSDRTLSQGSVKISIDDTAIEDLIEQRMDKLAEQVLGISMPARSREEPSPFAHQVKERVLESASEEIHAEQALERTNDPDAQGETIETVAEDLPNTVDIDPDPNV